MVLLVKNSKSPTCCPSHQARYYHHSTIETHNLCRDGPPSNMRRRENNLITNTLKSRSPTQSLMNTILSHHRPPKKTPNQAEAFSTFFCTANKSRTPSGLAERVKPSSKGNLLCSNSVLTHSVLASPSNPLPNIS